MCGRGNLPSSWLAPPSSGERPAVRGRILAAFLLFFGLLASAAQAQSSRPAALDPEKEQLLPPRKNGSSSDSANASSANRAASNTWDFTRVGIGLGVVLLLIFILQRTYKRLGIPGGAGRAAGLMQVVSRLNVSPRQQVILLKVGKRCVLVAANGTQMNSLCEITDPHEVALLVGQEAAGRSESSSSSFNAVLGDAQGQFETETQAAVQDGSDGELSAARQIGGTGVSPVVDGSDGASPSREGPDGELSAARQELTGLMERVRSLSRQFSKS